MFVNSFCYVYVLFRFINGLNCGINRINGDLYYNFIHFYGERFKYITLMAF